MKPGHAITLVGFLAFLAACARDALTAPAEGPGTPHLDAAGGCWSYTDLRLSNGTTRRLRAHSTPCPSTLPDGWHFE